MPFVNINAAYAQGIIQILTGAGPVPVERNTKTTDAKFRHGSLPPRLVLVAIVALEIDRRTFYLYHKMQPA
jgi:hypothetical protein